MTLSWPSVAAKSDTSNSTLDVPFIVEPAAYTISATLNISVLAEAPSPCTSNLSYGSSYTKASISPDVIFVCV